MISLTNQAGLHAGGHISYQARVAHRRPHDRGGCRWLFPQLVHAASENGFGTIPFSRREDIDFHEMRLELHMVVAVSSQLSSTSPVDQVMERLVYHQSKQRFQDGSRLFSSARVQEV